MERKQPAGARRAGQKCISRAPYGSAGREAQVLDFAGLEALARSFGSAKRAGDGWSCRCSLHDDKHASLSLGRGDGGKPLAHCHAGCDQREVFRAVLDRARELGLLPAPAKTGRPKAAKAAATTKRRRTWPAYDAQTGEPAGEHIREDGLNGKRMWWSRRGVRTADLALYRFQKLAEHPARSAVICEGEPTADALAELEDRLGVVAVGTVTGASGTPCDAALEPLRGRTVYLWPDADDPGRSHMSRIARRLTALGVEDIRMVDWPDAPERGDAADAASQGVDIAALLAAARPWAPAEDESGGEGVESETDGDPRPTIRIARAHYNEAARKVAELVRGRLFLLGGRLPVTVQRLRRSRKLSRHAEAGEGALVVEMADPEAIAGLADATIRFEKFDARAADWVPTSCPLALARRVLAGLAEIVEPLDRLAGVARVPLMRAYGERVGGGYDLDSEVFVDAEPPSGVPDEPTREDAERALARLLLPFRGYGLDENAELRACVAAATLTAVVRPSIPTSPAVLLDGNQPGIGKGLLARALAALATGAATPVVIGEGHGPEELGKTVDAVLMHAPDVVILDNLTRPLQCSRLEQFLTEGTATLRPLGASKLVTVSPRVFVLITANNAAIRTDMQRRMLPIRIVVLDERPELRRFDFDPVEEVLRDREELLRAAFTVLRWWQRELAAGAQWPELGSFREWSRLVAGAVRALTGVNLPELIAARRHDDPVAAGERTLFAQLAERFGDRPFKAADAVAALPVELWADLGLRTGAEGRPDARTLTAFLRRRKDAVRGSYVLAVSTDHRGTHEWRIVRAAGAPKCRTLPNSLPVHGKLSEEGRGKEGVTVLEESEAEFAEFGISAPPSAPANGLNGNENRADGALAARVAALLAAGKLEAAEGELAAAGAFPGPRTLRDLAAMQDVGAIRLELAALLGGDAS